jgi:hypothetical protein
VLVVDEVHLWLDGTTEGKGVDCTPALIVTAEWHLVRQSDGRALNGVTTACSAPTQHPSFVALFADEAKLSALMAAALQRLGNEMAAALRTSSIHPCRL